MMMFNFGSTTKLLLLLVALAPGDFSKDIGGYAHARDLQGCEEGFYGESCTIEPEPCSESTDTSIGSLYVTTGCGSCSPTGFALKSDLYKINEDTGETAFIGSIETDDGTGTNMVVNGMTYDRTTEEMYILGTIIVGGCAFGQPKQLYKLNLETAIATPFPQSTNLKKLGLLASNCNGDLFAWVGGGATPEDKNQNLAVFEKDSNGNLTGLVIDTGNPSDLLLPQLVQYPGLAFDEYNGLYLVGGTNEFIAGVENATNAYQLLDTDTGENFGEIIEYLGNQTDPRGTFGPTYKGDFKPHTNLFYGIEIVPINPNRRAGARIFVTEVTTDKRELKKVLDIPPCIPGAAFTLAFVKPPCLKPTCPEAPSDLKFELGKLGGCAAVLMGNNTKLRMSHSSLTGVNGNLCTANSNEVKASPKPRITGDVLVAGDDIDVDSNDVLGDVKLNEMQVSTTIDSIRNLMDTYASSTCDFSYSGKLKIDVATTDDFCGTSTGNVFVCVDELEIKDVWTLEGDCTVVFNVANKVSFNGSDNVGANAIINVLSDGSSSAKFSGGGGGCGCCNSKWNGALLSKGDVNISPGYVAFVAAEGDIKLSGGSTINCPSDATNVNVCDVR